MNCKKIEALLYLRADELSRSEKEQVMKHLAICAECSKLHAEIRQSINSFPKNMPIENDPEFTAMESLKIISSLREKEQSNANGWNRILDFALIPGIRYALSLVLILIFSFYFLQESIALRDISNLENRIQNKTEFPASPTKKSGFLKEIMNNINDPDAIVTPGIKMKLSGLALQLNRIKEKDSILKKNYPTLSAQLKQKAQKKRPESKILLAHLLNDQEEHREKMAIIEEHDYLPNESNQSD